MKKIAIMDQQNQLRERITGLWKKFSQLFWRKQNTARTLPTIQPKELSLIDNPEERDAFFEELRDHLYGLFTNKRVDRTSGEFAPPLLMYESGKLQEGRKYLYLKPLNQPGWLVEQTARGWVISRSEKIVSQDLFLRPNVAWDVVTLLKSNVPKNPMKSARVVSARLGDDNISFMAYRKLLVNEVLDQTVV